MMQRNLQSPHPRWPPSHLSVSLRHDGPSISSNRTDTGRGPAKGVDLVPSAVSPVKQSADENSGDTSGVGTWFNSSNKNPAVYLDGNFLDNDPPYFLPRKSTSDESKALSSSSPYIKHTHDRYDISIAGIPHSATKGSRADDFRSVIDDLTIENRYLKEKLRKYEGMYSTHLEKDKLFEVKVHGLSFRKKRELEETLRNFAASIDGTSDSGAKRRRSNSQYSAAPASKNTSLSSSTSRPTDSAYATMSASGPESKSTLDNISHDRAGHNQPSTDQNVQSFLHNIPEGRLPKHSLVMTERQKQKIVVRRLEQLFTGKRESIFSDHSQSLQQQEVSESAALADRTGNASRRKAEGVREAHILPYEMDVDSGKPSYLPDAASHATNASRCAADEVTDSSLVNATPEQRPTRPLDLDPDRAQIPSENVDYIRHLGLSVPNSQSWSSSDVEPDADGWTYLNLLVNMAQLHIINVTPDFVRSAVAEVSDKFQLSPDGRKIRWRGGTEGTQLSSDSGHVSAHIRSPTDNDRHEEGSRQKRQKTDFGHFASAAVESTNQNSQPTTTKPNPFHYKPLFHHRVSSSEETASSESEAPFALCHSHGDTSGTGKVSRTPRLRSRGSHSVSGRSSRRHGNGPIVFYSEAKFCIDLSRDRRSISTPLYNTAVGRDGYSNHSKDVLGSLARAPISELKRTLSGSLMRSRPFKDYSKGPDPFQTGESRPKTPDLISENSDDLDFNIDLEWSLHPAPIKPLIDLSASGLGGTQPADHFAIQVETRRTKLPSTQYHKISPFSAPRHGSRKSIHQTRSALKSFQEPESASQDDLSAALATLYARTPSPEVESRTKKNLHVQTDIVAARFARLQPSALPAPLGYSNTLPSSDYSDSDGSDSSYSGISHLKRAATPHQSASSIMSMEVQDRDMDPGEMQDDEESEDVDDDDDESIDMLAAARAADPETIKAREEEFEAQASRRLLEDLPPGSSAATVDGGSAASCAETSSEESSDDDMDFD